MFFIINQELIEITKGYGQVCYQNLTLISQLVWELQGDQYIPLPHEIAASNQMLPKQFLFTG